MENNPIAVAISDVHYDLNTLDLADAAMNQAIDLANEHNIPVLVNGDLHNTKSHLRSECVRRMVLTFKRCKIPAIINIGNHDKDNEKSETHALEFLRPYCTIVDKPTKNLIPYWTIIPYHHDADVLRKYLKTLPKKSRLFMHQGVIGSDAGEYIQDRSALNKEDLSSFVVISGHYHKSQTFELPKGGEFTYIGNPFSLNFGEAGHPDKGFILLLDDGTFERFETTLRKHIKIDIKVGDLDHPDLWQYNYNESDLLWVRVHGDSEYLKLSKQEIARLMEIKGDFKLELIPTVVESELSKAEKNQSPEKLLEVMIENATGLSEIQRKRIEALRKDLL